MKQSYTQTTNLTFIIVDRLEFMKAFFFYLNIAAVYQDSPWKSTGSTKSKYQFVWKKKTSGAAVAVMAEQTNTDKMLSEMLSEEKASQS